MLPKKADFLEKSEVLPTFEEVKPFESFDVQKTLNALASRIPGLSLFVLGYRD